MFGEDTDFWRLVFEETPFYGESGGQVGDTGAVVVNGREYPVLDTLKMNDRVTHLIQKAGEFPLKGFSCELKVDPRRRQATANNHTATHLLQAALRQVLGEHLHQSGSLVTPERLRFDFTHFEKISDADLERIEAIVNDVIRQGLPVTKVEMSYQDAVTSGATALFDEKYGDKVRVVTVEGFSKELCGGTHVNNTIEIRLFRIISEGSVATGVRRIEAVTGEEALKLYQQEREILAQVGQALKTDSQQIIPKLNNLLAEYNKTQKELAKASQDQASGQIKQLIDQIKTSGPVKYIVARVDGFSMEMMQEGIDKLRDAMRSGVAVLGSVTEGKVAFVVGVTNDLTAKIQAGVLIKAIATEAGGSGGGRPDMARAGGKDPAKIDAALQVGERMIKEKFGA
jgi:alanyl-tRNA synthetase